MEVAGAAPAGRKVGAVAAEKRRDLQGVRALAVLLVALNHANVPFLRGGYIGVDVFFVLSGYFITGLLLREALGGEHGREDEPASGRISIPKFYARRARRILPAATLTLAVTSIAVYVVYDLMRADYLGTKSTLQDSLAAALFYANFHFAATATNYFAQASVTMPSPVQHFWSLSVEEQFYLVWPSLLAGAFLICRRRRTGFDRRRAVRVLGAVIAIVCAGSLWWSIRDTSVSPQSAYFSTFARAWELGCGAGMALLAPRAMRLPKLLRITLGWTGLGMVLAAAVLYSSKTNFPGDAALLPVVGTAMMILAGLRSTRMGVDRLLGLRPLAYIGDRSYTFYLWHYPTLVLVWQAAGHPLSVGANLGLLTCAFALSALTYHFYENPLRHARFLHGWRTAAMVPVSIGAAVAAIMVPIVAFEASLAADASAATGAHVKPIVAARGQPDPTNLWDATPVPQVLAAAKAVKQNAPLPKAIVPSMTTLEQENTDITYDIPPNCQPVFGSGATSNICRLGDLSSRRVVVVFGDSHAQMWTPALIAAGKKQGFAIVPIVKPGCYVNRLNNAIAGWPCGSWYRWALQHVKALRPIATIVSFKLGTALREHPISTVADVRRVLKRVPNAVYLADPPGQSEQPAECIAKANATMRSCSSDEPLLYPKLMQDLAKMTQQLRDPAIPTIQWFCAEEVCPTVVDHTLTTHDGDHLTMEYSAELGPLLSKELRPILAHR
ncbi:MAG TPA: acyltransferase family protein [Solirubrobacteraceae bacterium]|jgi:peptidoglycan/LPS O-acetylase OafA/YrhL|nr:acyltransferase family protein [Solirubrobacteraceae bacterium]